MKKAKNSERAICYPKANVEPGAVVKNPGNQIESKTGSWRSFRPIVDKQKCIGCSACEIHCPDAAIRMVDGKAEVDYDYCKGCLICQEICPVKAITSEVERK